MKNCAARPAARALQARFYLPRACVAAASTHATSLVDADQEELCGSELAAAVRAAAAAEKSTASLAQACAASEARFLLFLTILNHTSSGAPGLRHPRLAMNEY